MNLRVVSAVATAVAIVSIVVALRAQATVESITSASWTATPLARLEDAAPGTGGMFKEFAEHYWIDSGVLLFWARFDNKHWALYSAKDGPPRLIGQQTEAFALPDGAKGWVARAASTLGIVQVPTPAVAGRRYFYLQPSIIRQQTEYTWDGSQVARLLGVGDKLTLPDGREALVDSIWLTNSMSDGTPVFWVRTKKPVQAEGFFVHDGAAFKPFLMIGDALKPLSGVTVSPVQFMVPGGHDRLAIDPLVFDDGTLAVLGVDHAPYKQALFRLTAAGAEKLLASNDPDPRTPKDKVGDILNVYASDAAHIVVLARSRFSPKMLVYADSKWKTIVDGPQDLPNVTRNEDYTIQEVAAAAPHSGRFVLSVLFPRRKLEEGTAAFMLEGSHLTQLPGRLFGVTQLPNGMGAAVFSAVLGDSGLYLAPGAAVAVPSPKLNVHGALTPLYLSDIIAMPDRDHLIAMPGVPTSGYYSLARSQ